MEVHGADFLLAGCDWFLGELRGNGKGLNQEVEEEGKRERSLDPGGFEAWPPKGSPCTLITEQEEL